jgi:Arc/MetJ family transcription regulator
MRTNIDVNQEIMADVIRLSKAKSQKKAIHDAILSYTRRMAQLRLLKLKGKMVWEGNLEEMRTSKYL